MKTSKLYTIWNPGPLNSRICVPNHQEPINQLERLVKTHLKLLKIWLTIQTNWPKVPYDSKKEPKKSYLLLQHQNTYVTTLLSCCIQKSIQKTHQRQRKIGMKWAKTSFQTTTDMEKVSSSLVVLTEKKQKKGLNLEFHQGRNLKMQICWRKTFHFFHV